MKNFKNYLGIFMIIALLFTQSAPAVVWAEEAPVAPVAQTAPDNTHTTPDAPAAPAAPAQGTTTAESAQPAADSSNSTSDTDEDAQEAAQREADREANKQAWLSTQSGGSTQSQNGGQQTGQTSNGNPGSTVVNTGDANNTSQSVTNGNTNAAVSGQSGAGTGNGTGAAIVNDGNGALSNNNANSASVVNNNTTQNNGAVVTNNANQATVTGDNQASFNMGDTVVKTGDANTSATAVTAVNTNVDGLMVSEFNYADDHKGDIILDAAAFQANCVSGCGGPAGTVANTGNGAYSDNNATSSSAVNNTTTQNNDAVVGNNMNLSANSGSNDASFNTGGDTIVYTGDANVNANSLTFANNNIAGNVTFGVVNIYGNLEGDIILPEFSGGSVGSNATTGTVANAGNGANSTNNAALNSDVNNTTNQNNNAVITNELIIDTETGANSANYGTDGNSTIKTGNTKVDANVVNIANTNINGGTWWLVFVNQAGNWIGKLVGSPDGSTMAGSAGTEFAVGPDGQVSVSNGGNGAGSTNNAATSSTVNNTTDQNNTANIHNTLNLSANTGANNANYNTGGSNSIVTGDANVIANIVNFVNNNVVGNGTLAVTFVNVFGSWIGDFVAPGQQKQPKPTITDNSVTENRGGVAETANNTVNETVTTVNETVVYAENEEENGDSTVTTNSSVAGVYKSKSRSVVGNNGDYAYNYGGTQVAGVSSSNNNGEGSVVKQLIGSENKKVLNLNLAYFVLALPLFILAMFSKKLIFNKLLTKKN